MKRDNDGSTPYPLGRALDFLQRLWQLNHALERLSSRMEKSFGVTAQQRLMVRCVGKYPGMTAGQLAILLHVDPGTVSAALKRLEDKALLARRRDARDNRRVVLGLTAKGQRLAHPVPGTVEHAVECLLDSVSVRDIDIVKATLEQLTKLLTGAADGKSPVRKRRKK